MDLRAADTLGAQEQLTAAAARMGLGLAQLATDIRSVIEAEIPALREGDDMLEASVRSNVERMLGFLEHGIDPAAMEPPAAAVEHARRLAQRGVSVFALIRAYRVGHAEFLNRMIRDLVAHGSGTESAEGRATLELVDGAHVAIDRVIEALLVTYAQARDEWLNPNAIVRARVRSVLAEKDLDFETAQSRIGGYRLNQRHVSGQVWFAGDAAGQQTLGALRGLVDRLVKAAGLLEAPLFVALDESSASVWLPLGSQTALDRRSITDVIAGTPGAYIALGEPEPSLPGFRRTHEQSLTAQSVARVSSPPRERVTPFGEVAPIAAMATNLESTRAWVAETLGGLAVDGERQSGLRETLRVFLKLGGSYTATAKQLGVHRNTAQYRVHAAEEMRGRPISDGHLDVELALLAGYWLGPAVLQPAHTG